jgi:hypothetical protein
VEYLKDEYGFTYYEKYLEQGKVLFPGKNYVIEQLFGHEMNLSQELQVLSILKNNLGEVMLMFSGK